ncbi:MAG: hypothetical protein NW220_12700 [Leptolyngbyaceae cyanobacterium bins.349]|nr:hypothetical protein [Leptolyngbyaceae cyanobacterium bins.349]
MMSLETEFRIRVELMQWEQAIADQIIPWCDRAFPGCHHDTPKAWNTELPPQWELTPSTWVKLWQDPGIFSSDDALLLCQLGHTQWLAWIPDYGELVLEREEFYLGWEDMD